jgi:DNA-binding transcriptional ArsR family regulator
LCDFDLKTAMAALGNPGQPVHFYRFPPHDRTAAGDQANDCVVALRALGEDTRVRIVAVLIDAPLDVGEIAERVGVSQYNVSKHLRILREAGLLQLEKRGRRHLYALSDGIRRDAAGGGVLDLGCCSFQFDRNVPLAEGRQPSGRITRARGVRAKRAARAPR